MSAEAPDAATLETLGASTPAASGASPMARLATSPTRLAVVAILVAAALVGLAWAILGRDVPDEPGYFGEIAEVAEVGSSRSLTGHPVGVFAYAGAAFYRAGMMLGLDPLLAVRFLGVACIVGVTLLTYLTLRTLDDNAEPAAIAAAALVAFNPMFTFIGASSNSDTMLTLWCALVAYAAVRCVSRPIDFAGIALLAAGLVLGYLTKERALALVPAAIAAVGIGAIWRLEPVRRTSQNLVRRIEEHRRLALVGCAIAVIGLGLVLHARTTTGYSAPALSSGLPSPGTTWALLSDPAFIDRWAKQFFAYFGYLQIPGPPWMFVLQRTVFTLALAGWLFKAATWATRSSRDTRSRPPEDAESMRSSSGRGLAVLGMVVASVVYATVYYHLWSGGGSQGRYLFVAIVPIYAFVAIGLMHLTPAPARGGVLWLVIVGALGVNLWSLLYIVVPYFY